MFLHCTKALLDKLKPNDIVLTPIDQCEDMAGGLYSWHAHFTTINRRKAVVFMNNLTRYSVVLYRPKAKDFKNIDQIFKEGIRTAFRNEGFSEEITEEYLKNCGEIQYAKTAGRKMTAYLNKACEAVCVYSEHLIEDSVIQNKISLFTGRYLTNYENEKYEYPSEMMARALCTMSGLDPENWKNIRNVESYQLLIQLELDHHDIWRRIIIPSRATFYSLYKTIQEVFDWLDYHLHEFYVLEDSERYTSGRPFYTYARKLVIVDGSEPDVESFLDPDKYEIKEERTICLSEVFRENKMCIYNYDFGDDWNHVITLEKVISDGKELKPLLVDRKGKRPPEDVGGESGFDEYLRIISDKNDPEYEEMIIWAEGQKERDRTMDEINERLGWLI